MLHDILMAAFDGAHTVLRSLYVSNYFFPVASGFWLTVFVANKVRFEDTRTQAAERIAHVRRQVADVRKDAKIGDWWKYYNEMEAELEVMRNQLRAQNQLVAAERLERTSKVIYAGFSAAFKAGRDAMPQFDVGGDFQEWNVRAGKAVFAAGREAIQQYMDTAIPMISDKIGDMQGEWLAFLDLPTAAGIWRRLKYHDAAESVRKAFGASKSRTLDALDLILAGYARRSDCGNCCAGCNRQGKV